MRSFLFFVLFSLSASAQYRQRTPEDAQYRERSTGHMCGEDEVLARLSKKPGDMVDKLLKYQPTGGVCEDGPERPIPPLIAEVTCSSSGATLKQRLSKLTKNEEVAAHVVDQCGDNPEVAKWATPIIAAQLKTPEGREWGVNTLRPLAEWKNGGPLAKSLVAALREDLGLKLNTNRVQRELQLFVLLAPDLDDATRAELAQVLEDAFAKESVGERPSHAPEIAHTISMTGAWTESSRKQMVDLAMKTLTGGNSLCLDEWSAEQLVDAVMSFGPPVNEPVEKLLRENKPLGNNECVNVLRMSELAKLPPPRDPYYPEVAQAKAALMDPSQTLKTRLTVAKTIEGWQRDMQLGREVFGLEEWTVIHALESRQKMNEQLQSEFIHTQYATGATRDIDMLNVCRLEAGLPSLRETDFAPYTATARPGSGTADCLGEHLCAPGAKVYAETMQRCCALGFGKGPFPVWCTAK